MDQMFVTEIMDALYTAGKIPRIVPELPPHVQRGQADILSAIYKLSQEQDRVRVTDISRHKRVSSPGIIRRLKTCVDCGFVEKTPDPQDRRVVYVSLTPAGLDVLENTFGPFHRLLAEKFSREYPDRQWRQMADMIYDALEMIQAAAAEMGNQLK